MTDNRESLRDRVVVVAGATRGAGRGIASAFGEAGATVVCTGRSTDGSARAFGPAKSDYDRAETIEETARLVTSLGGKGVPFVVDHLASDQVAELATHLREKFGHIDVLVNDIWGAEKLKGGPGDWTKPIWEFDLDKGLRILRLGIDTHLITSHHLLPLVINRPGGLVVEVTDGTREYNDTRTRLSVFYDLAKISVNRLAFSQGNELKAHGATAVAISPGWMRSELMLENFQVTEDDWREAVEQSRSDRGLPVAPPSFILSETPRFVGRAIVAIASDHDRARWNQQSVDAGRLAREYQFTDVDGSRPDIWRYMFDEEKGIAKGFDEYR
jgi:NAD(P)-dependent dehydrogenase (short-subunit alcohol dehydrogenase family)